MGEKMLSECKFEMAKTLNDEKICDDVIERLFQNKCFQFFYPDISNSGLRDKMNLGPNNIV